MFYQNSNDLVKNASVTSGHVQNSSGTREVLVKQVNTADQNDGSGGNGSGISGNGNGSGESLSFGAKFQNMIQGIIDSVSLKEGLDGAGSGPANPSNGMGGNTSDQTSFIKDKTTENKNYTQQELDHITRVADIMKLVDNSDKSSRQKWVEVTDSAGVTKYGYITKDGIFQIWNAPTSPITNWFQTDKMKQNVGVLGCPAPSASIQKIKIAGTWETIKPFDMVYADNDSGQKNPLFLLVNDTVRNPKNTVNGKGLFSCGNERTNVYVSQRPSADFQFPGQDGVDTIQMGCYVIADNVKDSDIKNRGFTFQDDLTEASISQCKRRAEDLGSSYFLVSAPQPGKPNNRGGCWIYTGDGKPNIDGILTFNTNGAKCHTVGNPEDDEDGYLKAYTPSNLKRMYGKEHSGSSTTYVTKGDGMWAGEQADEYTCNGAKGRNTTGDGGNFNRYCIFDAAEDAKNWCSSDPNCLGYLNTNRKYQVTKKPVVNRYGGTYFEKNAEATKTQTVALYALKSGGPTGVDTANRNSVGSVGKIAYIDHNGERHEYPASALSFIKPTKENPAKYINLGGYDTRSAESSYALKEITPGSFSDAANLLYKASRDGWTPQKFHQLCDNKGATYTRVTLADGRVIGAYTSVSWTSNPGYVNDSTAFLYDGTRKYTTNSGAWGLGSYATYMNASYFPTFGGGHDLYIGGDWMYMNAYSYVASDRSAPFTRKIQMANIYGPWVGRQIPAEIKFLDDGRTVYLIEDGTYTKMVSSDGQEKYYVGNISQFNPANWNSYTNTGGGKYLLNRINQFKEFPRRGWGAYEKYSLRDIEVYSVDASLFPSTNPPDYARRLRTMPVGESITASMEKCRGMCDDDEKCGGFVYTKSGSSTDGKCELKDRTKMYPVGLRVADSTKQLMLKVPTINGTIRDDTCKTGNGAYTTIDSAQYAHYPDAGAMTSDTKCKINEMIPKKGELSMPDVTPMIGAVDKVINETNSRAAEYRAQMTTTSTSSGGSSAEPFTGREGMDNTGNSNYIDTMKGVQTDLTKIANAEYQRERLRAMTDETNKLLISESYKFILWSILAILAVMALLKLKEMFGQDDVEEGGGDEDGGLFAYILGLFGIGSVNTDDIADRTGDVKEALSSMGNQLKEAGENLTTGITEGADNLVASANDAASGVVEGARGFADKVSETATDAVNQIGDAVGNVGAGAGAAPGSSGAATTGGRSRGPSRNSGKK
jgi:hypothetical protein